MTIIISINSCSPCFKTECLNGGECNDGKCLCDDGEERSDCFADPCVYKDPCVHGETCLDGQCQCDDYYTGEYCEISVIQSYAGVYALTNSCDGFATYNVQFLNGTFENRLTINDPYKNTQYNVLFSSVNEFTIPLQYTSNYFQVQGTGEIRDGYISYSITYEEMDWPYSRYSCLFSN